MMSHISKNLIRAYNGILKATEHRVKEISPKLDLKRYILNDNISESELIKNMNELTLFVRSPGYAYLYLKKKDK